MEVLFFLLRLTRGRLLYYTVFPWEDFSIGLSSPVALYVLRFTLDVSRFTGTRITPAGDFNEMVPELSLNRTMNRSYFLPEYDGVKFSHHLTRGKRP